MKIKIQVTLDVDPDRWAVEYNLDRPEVRADVQSYFAGLCEQHLMSLGLEAQPVQKDAEEPAR